MESGDHLYYFEKMCPRYYDAQVVLAGEKQALRGVLELMNIE
jgi:hypothetical protein